MPRGIAGSKADSVWVATETFACEIDGAGVIVHAGQTRVREGHPMLDTYRGSFKLADQGVHFDMVEQATAAPGEKRGAPQQAREEKPVEKDEPSRGPLKTSDVKR
jgi:hypothetical protein